MRQQVGPSGRGAEDLDRLRAAEQLLPGRPALRRATGAPRRPLVRPARPGAGRPPGPWRWSSAATPWARSRRGVSTGMAAWQKRSAQAAASRPASLRGRRPARATSTSSLPEGGASVANHRVTAVPVRPRSRSAARKGRPRPGRRPGGRRPRPARSRPIRARSRHGRDAPRRGLWMVGARPDGERSAASAFGLEGGPVVGGRPAAATGCPDRGAGHAGEVASPSSCIRQSSSSPPARRW